MATQDDAAKKAADDAARKAAEDKGGEDKGDQIDPTIAALMKDPDAIAALIKTKQGANAEAKTYRLKLEALEKAEKEAKDKALVEQGEFKTLAERAKAETEQAKTSFKKRLVDLTLKTEAITAGSVDPDLVVLAVDRAGIKVSDDMESVEGVKEAVEALKKAKPHLFPATEDGKPAPKTTQPAPRGGFTATPGDFDKTSPRDLISKGFAKK